jgi:broad specificity phosphatase PhoE
MQSELLTLSSLPNSFTVYVARHATPDRSRSDIPYHIPPGPPLTERGLSEAAALGDFLREAGVLYFLSSPLERAWRTASIAAEVCGAGIEQNIGLAEWRPEENEAAVRERVSTAFLAACQMSSRKEGPVALVSHGFPTLTLTKALGLPPETIERCRIYDSRNLVPMSGAWRVECVDGELTLRLVFVPQGLALPAGY